VDWHEALLKAEYSFQSEQLGKSFPIPGSSLQSLMIIRSFELDFNSEKPRQQGCCSLMFQKPSLPSDDQVSKKPKLQANLLSVVTSVAMELESVSDENFES